MLSNWPLFCGNSCTYMLKCWLPSMLLRKARCLDLRLVTSNIYVILPLYSVQAITCLSANMCHLYKWLSEKGLVSILGEIWYNQQMLKCVWLALTSSSADLHLAKSKETSLIKVMSPTFYRESLWPGWHLETTGTVMFFPLFLEMFWVWSLPGEHASCIITGWIKLSLD